MVKEELIAEIERLRTLSAGERLFPFQFDNLMLMVGGTTWKQEVGDDSYRNHPLVVGEIVFDINTRFFGVIVELKDGKAVLDMNGKYNDEYVPKDFPLGWCEKENRLMFDNEIEENELKWETDELDELYQVAWNVVDVQEENYVCYEHNITRDNYPYYSPYRDENMFYFETKEI